MNCDELAIKLRALRIVQDARCTVRGAARCALDNVADYIIGLWPSLFAGSASDAAHQANAEERKRALGLSGHPCDSCGEDTTRLEVAITATDTPTFVCPACALQRTDCAQCALCDIVFEVCDACIIADDKLACPNCISAPCTENLERYPEDSSPIEG